jgi:hypothetical protein
MPPATIVVFAAFVAVLIHPAFCTFHNATAGHAEAFWKSFRFRLS